MRFVDTSFWVALRFARDQNHEPAVALWREEREPLVTTNHILGETWTFLNRRVGHDVAWPFIEAAQSSARLAILHVDEGVERAAWEWLRRHNERPYSFVDATSLLTMRQLRLSEALAFDGGFSAEGFTELRP